MKKTFIFTTFMLIYLVTITQAQTIISVAPDNGTQCQQLTLTVTGENTDFYQGTSTMWLELDGFNINPVSNNVVSPTQIEGVFFFNPEHTVGIYDVHAHSGVPPDDIVLPEGFLLDPVDNLPQLISAEPDTAYGGETILMIITCEYTHFDASDIYNEVWLNSSNGGYLSTTLLTVIDSQHLEASIFINNYKPAGKYTLHVRNRLDGELTLPEALTLIEGEDTPAIVSVNPNTALQGEALTITVTGNNTFFQQGTSVLVLEKSGQGTIYPENHNVLNDTVMTGDFSFNQNHAIGFYDVTVTDWNLGDITMVDGFTLNLLNFIDDKDGHPLLTVYPNPTNGLLFVKRNYTNTGHFVIKVYNTKGLLLLEDYVENGISEKQIDLSTFPKGIYLLKIVQGEKEQVKRFIIQ